MQFLRDYEVKRTSNDSLRRYTSMDKYINI